MTSYSYELGRLVFDKENKGFILDLNLMVVNLLNFHLIKWRLIIKYQLMRKRIDIGIIQ